jgi:hypothetical protein
VFLKKVYFTFYWLLYLVILNLVQVLLSVAVIIVVNLFHQIDLTRERRKILDKIDETIKIIFMDILVFNQSSLKMPISLFGWNNVLFVRVIN